MAAEQHRGGAPATVDAVVFDMGGVFVIPHEDPIGEAIVGAGVALELGSGAVHRAHYRGVRALTELLDRQSVAETDPEVWRHYDRAYFLAVGVGEDHIDAVMAGRQAQRNNGVKGVWRHLLRYNISAFARIAGRLPVAIVTNNDGTAAQQCADFGICQVGEGSLPSVAAIIDSTTVGVAKPDPRIFEPALAALGTEAARTLYVGDTVHADVAGAAAAGMPVVQLDPLDLHGDHDHWRLPDVVALADHLLA